MTIGTTSNLIVVEGNGVTVTFTYDFLIPQASDAVLTYVDASGNQTVLASTQYTITGLGNPSGGSVTYPLSGSPMPNGAALVIERVLPLVQTTSISNQGPTFQAIESALDYLTMCLQQQSSAAQRTLTGNIADPSGLLYEAPPVAERASQFMGWDSSGNVMAGLPSGSGVPISAAMQPVVEAATTALAANLMGVLPTAGGTMTGTINMTNGAALNCEAGSNIVLGGGQLHATAGGSILLDNGSVVGNYTPSYTSGAMQTPFCFLLNGLDPTTEFQNTHAGATAIQALVAGQIVPVGSTAYDASGINTYMVNLGTHTTATGAEFYVRSGVTGGNIYGVNPLVTDFANGVTTPSIMVGAEFDIGGGSTSSTCYGINMIGVFPNGTPSTSVAFQVSQLNYPWSVAYLTGDASCETAFFIGNQTAAGTSDGQQILFNCRDSAGNGHQSSLMATPNGTSGAIVRVVTPGASFEVVGDLGVVGLANMTDGATVGIAAPGPLISFFQPSGLVGSITTNGSSTAYNTTSDRRLKNLTGSSDGSLIDRVSVHLGTFKADAANTVRSMLIADEVQEVAPWMVTGEPNAVYPEDVWIAGQIAHKKGDPLYQLVDHSAIVPDLIAKCQRLQSQNDVLTREISTVNATIAALQAQVASLTQWRQGA